MGFESFGKAQARAFWFRIAPVNVEPCAQQFAGTDADWRSESAFAVDTLGGAAQLWDVRRLHLIY